MVRGLSEISGVDEAFEREGLALSPCNLCPRLCGAHRDGEGRGLCGAGGKMAVARAALHFWEEPPLSGESGSGAVFFTHCPLRCVYCQNATIAAGGAGVDIDEERLAGICGELEAQGALNVNFVTPTHFSPLVARAVARARMQGFGLPVVWNTSGYERVETIRALERTANVYLADFKYASPELAWRYSKARDYPQVALDALAEMVFQAGSASFDEYRGQTRITGGVIVRHLLLPGALEESKAAVRMLFERFGDTVVYSLMNQYTPLAPPECFERFPQLASRVPDEEYEELLDFADRLGLEDYYWQQGPAASESFVPAWDGTGV